MASTQKRQVLYSASTPIQGAAASATSYASAPESRGLVPYFVRFGAQAPTAALPPCRLAA